MSISVILKNLVFALKSVSVSLLKKTTTLSTAKKFLLGNRIAVSYA